MPNIAIALRDEISRLARKEIRRECMPLRKSLTRQRHELAQLRNALGALTREFAKATKARNSGSAVRTVSTSRQRLSAKGLKSLRGRLGLSAGELGALIGVTAQSIYAWEQERAQPRAAKLQSLFELRGVGKKAAKARVAALGKSVRRKARAATKAPR